MKTIAYTFRIGSPDWAKECGPTIDAWLHDHDIEVVVIDQREPGWPSLKHQIVDYIRDFVRNERGDRMVYLDWDLMVSPRAPFLPEHGITEFMARVDHPAVLKYWDRWRKQHYPNEPRLDDWNYLQAGIWSMGSSFAKFFTEELIPPYIEGQMEQHQWNVWLCRMARRFGTPFNLVELPREFNTITQLEDGDAWIHHVAGKEEDKPALIAASKKRFL